MATVARVSVCCAACLRFPANFNAQSKSKTDTSTLPLEIPPPPWGPQFLPGWNPADSFESRLCNNYNWCVPPMLARIVEFPSPTECIAPFCSKMVSPSRQHMLTSQKIEKKRLEYEKIREQRRLFDAEMAKHEAELSQMLEEHGRLSGHQSEPTTPPEYRETTTGFPSVFSRPNRYSLSSLTSPHGMANRSARSGSVLTSPQSGIPLSRFAFDDQLPSWSHTTSRRNSDDDEKEEAVRQDPTSHRSTNAYVGLSVPVSYFLELCVRACCCVVLLCDQLDICCFLDVFTCQVPSYRKSSPSGGDEKAEWFNEYTAESVCLELEMASASCRDPGCLQPCLFKLRSG